MILETLKSKSTDFKWEKGTIIPQNNIGIYRVRINKLNNFKI